MKTDGGLRSIFRKRLPKFDWVTIESGLTGKGIPDSNFCRDGAEGWIEYKKTAAYAVRVAKEQVAWHERRARNGGRTFIAVRRKRKKGPRTIPCDELWLFRGVDVRHLMRHGLGFNALGSWRGGPARWDWTHIASLLQGDFPAGPRWKDH